MTHQPNLIGRRGFRAMGRDKSGAISPLMALAVIPLIGALGYAAEASSLFYAQRNMQNAADSAALAAATNACAVTAACHTAALSPTYDAEAKSVTKRLGFTDGAASTTVLASNTAICPATGLAKCYSVTITRVVPLYLVKALGFKGDKAGGQTVVATAIASAAGGARTYCVLSLATTGVGIQSKGGSQNNPTGCHMMSDSTSSNATSCTGAGQHPIADIVDAVGTSDSNCVPLPGSTAHSGVASVSDSAYRALASNIPADSCGGKYLGTTWSTDQTLGATPPPICGTLSVTQNVKITTPAGGSVLTVYNGDVNVSSGKTLQSKASSGVTIVFTGTKAGASHIPNGSGTIDIAAPTTGVWKGIALYQDPATTTGVNLPQAGNAPAWAITGLTYFPNSVVVLKGNIQKATNGVSCFSIVDLTFELNGAVSIFADSQKECEAAGLAPPTGQVGGTRQSLVQ